MNFFQRNAEIIIILLVLYIFMTRNHTRLVAFNTGLGLSAQNGSNTDGPFSFYDSY